MKQILIKNMKISKKQFITENIKLFSELTEWYAVNIESDNCDIDGNYISNWLVDAVTLTVKVNQGLDSKQLNQLLDLGFEINRIDYEEPNLIIKVKVKKT